VKGGRSSFLKKRTKKLFESWAAPLRKGRRRISKSFLLLFSKKKALFFFEKKNQKTFYP